MKKRKKTMRLQSSVLTLAVALSCCLPGIVMAEETQSATAEQQADHAQEQTQATDQQSANKPDNKPVTDIPQTTNVPVAEVEVKAKKEQPPTIGQQPDAEGVNNYVITHSSAGSKSDIASKDLPQTITSIGQKVMKEQHITTFDQALANIAGVFPTETLDYWHNEGRYSIRGFGSGFDAPFYVNGMSDIDSTLSRWTGNIDRIEVLKGPASVLYGNGSPGGLINFVTKKPLPYLSYTIGTDYLSWGGRSQDIDMSIPLTEDKKWLSRTIIQNADYRSFQQGVKYKRFDGSFVVVGQPKPDITYTFEMGYHHHHGLDPANLTLPAIGTIYEPYGLIPYDANYNNPDVKGTYIARNIQARVDYKVNDIWTIHTALGYSKRSTYVNSEFIYNNSVNTSTHTIDKVGWTEKFGSTDTRSWETTANGKFKAWGVNHDLTLGYTWSYSTWDNPWCNYNRGTLGSVDIFHPVFPAPWKEGGWTSDDPEKEYRYGSYISDVVELSPKLKFSAGISFTKDKLNDEDYEKISGRSWRSGFSYETSSGVVWFVGRSTYYEPLSNQTNTAGKTFHFKPETGDQVEGGVKVDLSNRASVTLSTYRINRNNRVYTLPPATDPKSYAQIGRQTSKGIDLDVSYVISPGWNLLLAYSHCNAEITKDSRYAIGSRLPNIPIDTLRLWSTYEAQDGHWKGWGFGGGITHVGNRALSYDKSDGSLHGYTTLDGVIYYKTKNYRYSLNAYNLTNRKYWAYGGTNYVQAGTPRNYILRVERTF